MPFFTVNETAFIAVGMVWGVLGGSIYFAMQLHKENNHIKKMIKIKEEKLQRIEEGIQYWELKIVELKKRNQGVRIIPS